METGGGNVFAVLKRHTIRTTLMITLIIGCGTYGILHYQTISVPVASSSPHDELIITALVTTYLKEIQTASNQYYMDYLVISPQIAYYNTTVKEITLEGNRTYIVFSTLPYVGPHDTVGEDEITFSVDHAGNIILEKFDHIEGHSLPDNLKSLLKQPILNTNG